METIKLDNRFPKSFITQCNAHIEFGRTKLEEAHDTITTNLNNMLNLDLVLKNNHQNAKQFDFDDFDKCYYIGDVDHFLFVKDKSIVVVNLESEKYIVHFSSKSELNNFLSPSLLYSDKIKIEF